jgi:hypothetical protein
VLKSEDNLTQCFHYGYSVNFKEDEKEKEKANKLPSTKEEEEKYKYYKEQQESYHKKKGVFKFWGAPKLKGMKTDIDLL